MAPLRLQTWKSRRTRHRPGVNEEPLRGELFSLDQLASHARTLAGSHQIFTGRGSNRLLERLDHNEKILGAFNRETQIVDKGRRVTHAAEWLLDNFYLIEEQIQMTRRHLPPAYSSELPRLLGGSSARLPRVYDIILELISHVDAQIDIEPLSAFVAAYQTVAPLKLGELWAIPIMLRLGLIENLQRVTSRLQVARRDRDLAGEWMDRLREMSETNPSSLVIVMAEMARSELSLSSSFVAEFCQMLSQHSPVMNWVRNWLEQKLSERGDSIEQLVYQESQMQAADQVSISHSINSLRFLSGVDWKDFVESLSHVERTLREDPAGIYGAMDFSTRDFYRHSVETIARTSRLEETGVARRAVDLAASHAGKGGTDRKSHIGYHLIDKGRASLEKAAGSRPDWKTLLPRGIRRAPMVFYAGSIMLLTVLGTLAFFLGARHLEMPPGKLLCFTALFAACLSQTAVSLVNLFSSLFVMPRPLPRMDYSASGIPAPQRSIVVIPTIIAGPDDVNHLIEALEIHYLANRDPHLHFALLTDFADAAAEVLPGDDALVAQARAGVEALNRKYHGEQEGAFYLLHRPRRWNEKEGRWMGYERKRGKLTEFNALLLGASGGRFSEIVGDRSLLAACRFVITLDTDTQLPRGAAHRLIGAMAHPLNRPVFDPVKNIVTEGYGILQPRVGACLPSSRRSWFARVFAGEAGIDPYTRAASDTYQDVFDEGSFIGKGIYDAKTFEQAAEGRFPENLILSHDLIEACHARSALASDVELYEAYPSRYLADASRRHRWIRGDWQISRWLLPRVREAGGRRAANPLSVLSKWKIGDNLRRSLVPIALMVFLPGIWLFAPAFGAPGVLAILAILLAPGLAAVTAGLIRKPPELPLPLHLRGVTASAGRHAAQFVLGLAFLPHEAYLAADAILRTLWRLRITGRRLLEWKTSSDAERTACHDLAGHYKAMWAAPALALGMAAYVLAARAELTASLPLLGLWLASPWIAWRLSQPIIPPTPELTQSQRMFLRKTARKTWRYFETFVTEEENWLPPDNFQEQPARLVASRTSPTNMGLALLANLAARDFGYIPAGDLIRRTQKAFATMQGLPKHRGHFYNWYDTRTLEPLRPFYVSSVDSGNLAGHLLTLGPGFDETQNLRLYEPEIFSGLLDTLAILEEVSGLDLGMIRSDLARSPGTLREAAACLQRVAESAARIAIPPDTGGEGRFWREALEKACRDHHEDFLFVAPWLALPARSWKSTGLDPGLIAKLSQLDEALTLREVAELDQTLCPLAQETLDSGLAKPPWGDWLSELLPRVHLASDRAGERIHDLGILARQCLELADMDFTFLFDAGRDLFSIGFNTEEHRVDASYYDLLASEARLCSYVAVAQGQVTQDHWFSLGRLLLAGRGRPVLASWSGSLFEYLMPLLVMPNYENTLLDQTYKGAVEHQIAYGRSSGIPWGVSESGYNRTDIHLNYQYRAFGVPGLGLKRGLADDQVIAPYATVMALMVMPRLACENLERLAADGREGAYGFYEAVDYTPSRLPPGQTGATVRSFMAHHQGMSLLALDYLLRDRPMQRRFMACPLLKASELLLHERVPKTVANVLSVDWTEGESRKLAAQAEGTMQVITNPGLPAPDVHLMSNGHYHVAVSSAGGGYSRWQDLAVTRWREDATRDCWGTFIYLRDVETGEFWSAGHQPALRSTESYQAIFTQARAELRQRHRGIEAHTEITVSPEDDLELRRVTLTNHSDRPRAIELTSYAEVVLAPAAADATHPAFSNLFVQTEFVSSYPAILCTRRARSESEHPPWLYHLLVGQGGEQGEASCETDRSRFIGRGNTPFHPAALQKTAPLSNTVGSVLDPIVALRRQVMLAPGESARMDFIVGVSENREAALALADKYNSVRMADRTLDLAWTHSQVTLRQLNISEAEAQLYGRLASGLIYASSVRRAAPSVLLSNRRGQSGLWGYGISGDFPVVLLRIMDKEKIEIVRQLIQAHSYWRLKGLTVDLVILNDDESIYRQPLYNEIISLVSAGSEAHMLDRHGGIFVRNAEQVSNEDRILLQAVARVVLVDENGTLTDQMERHGSPEPVVPALSPIHTSVHESPELPWRDLILHNGFGGFTPDGREYVTTLRSGESTPAPWVNVLANPSFGTVISESGSSYTWAENCHEFRLTPWTNDPVSDLAGEFFYIRDEHTGRFWSPSPSPSRGATPYVTRHGFGYTVFEHIEDGIASELWIYVAADAPVKFAALKVRNTTGSPRRVSVTGYWEWILGELRQKNLLHIQTELDPKSGALLARNPYNTEFPERIVFLDVNDATRSFTGDRREFFGRNGSPAKPAALKRTKLSGKTGAGLDPCGAMQLAFDLPAGQERETTFRLGVGRNAGEVQSLIQRFRRPGACRLALEGVWQYWNHTLSAVQVETPDPAVNIMANGWLLYQTLSCRLWARTGFYQSGGAFGFRDQLQDVMALIHAEPALVREHLLRAGARQFLEGDVQHWWHPPQGRGVRTHFSDDYLWLPYVTCHYVSALGDTGVLDESVPFLEGRPVRPEEEAYYDLPHRAGESATLYEHCVRAIKNGLKFGGHGLPLIGCGDWNDGMNMVGKEGRGESVWLAFFLYDVLIQFAGLAQRREDADFAKLCRTQAARLQKNIELNGWDGEWYLRAYFDNGIPLGSRTNPECQIDALPQSWAVLSGAGDPQRVREAMNAVERRLVRRDAGLVQLFDPPFDSSDLNPGYIKGYIPGVRENGGQYTHAAIWATMAFALMGDTERAWELFEMLNPIRHGDTSGKIATYKVEPYVVAADVYGVSPHTGRGGWTWYTGSAGWMYRAVIETLLGVKREGDRLRLTPRLPKAWNTLKIRYRHHQTHYHIVFLRIPASGTPRTQIVLDGRELPDDTIPLVDDHQDHAVEVQIFS